MDIVSRVKELARPTGEEDLLDVRYPKPRLAISLKHGAVVAAIMLVGIGFFVLSSVLNRPSPATSSNPYALGNVTSAPRTSAPSLVVSVVGAVQHPQLVTLTPNARVADALDIARPLVDADLAAINQAQKLVDGTQLHVPRFGEPAPAATAAGSPPAGSPQDLGTASSPGMISLNSSDAKQLEELPGVGAKTAEAIIAHREAIGGFTAIEQLMDVKGIGPAKFDKMKDVAAL